MITGPAALLPPLSVTEARSAREGSPPGRLAVPPALEPPPAVGVLPAQPSTVLPPLWPATARDSTHIRMMEWLREDPPSVQSQCSRSAATVQSECLSPARRLLVHLSGRDVLGLLAVGDELQALLGRADHDLGDALAGPC